MINNVLRMQMFLKTNKLLNKLGKGKEGGMGGGIS